RRHTRFSRDWSSDVCSSDLAWPPALLPIVPLSGTIFALSLPVQEPAIACPREEYAVPVNTLLRAYDIAAAMLAAAMSLFAIYVEIGRASCGKWVAFVGVRVT